jgi:acyl-CoA thioesterase FadM
MSSTNNSNNSTSSHTTTTTTTLVSHETVSTTLRIADFDRNLTLSAATLLRLAMEARWRSSLLQKIRASAPDKRVMVKAQVIRRVEPYCSTVTFDLVHRPVFVTQIPHSVSRSSLTLAYDIRMENNGPTFAQAMVVIVFVDITGPVPKAVPLPPFVHTDIVWASNATSPPSFPTQANGDHQVTTTTNPSSSTDLTIASTAVANVLSSPQRLSSARILPHNVLPRFSDEDLNHHVSHAAYANFFTDALSGVGLEDNPELMYIEYMSEVRQGERCTVSIVQNDPRSLILFLVKESDPSKPAVRAFCSYSITSQEIVPAVFGQ